MSGERIREHVEQPEPIECRWCYDPATIRENGEVYCSAHDPQRARENAERDARNAKAHEASAARDAATVALIAAAYTWRKHTATNPGAHDDLLAEAVDAAIAAGVPHV